MIKKAVAFLKKSSAKNFCAFLHGLLQRPAVSKSFFGSFFSKKELLALPDAAP